MTVTKTTQMNAPVAPARCRATILARAATGLRLLLLLAVALFALGLADRSAPLRAEGDKQRMVLRLHNGTFDPLQESPAGAWPPATHLPEQGQQPYLVQFTGPILEGWKAEAAATGAQIVEHVPDKAFWRWPMPARRRA